MIMWLWAFLGITQGNLQLQVLLSGLMRSVFSLYEVRVNKLRWKLVHDFNTDVSSYWCGQIYYRSTFLGSSLPNVLSYLLEKLWLDGLLGEMNHSTSKVLDILSKRWIADSLKRLSLLGDNLWSSLNFQSMLSFTTFFF